MLVRQALQSLSSEELVDDICSLCLCPFHSSGKNTYTLRLCPSHNSGRNTYSVCLCPFHSSGKKTYTLRLCPSHNSGKNTYSVCLCPFHSSSKNTYSLCLFPSHSSGCFKSLAVLVVVVVLSQRTDTQGGFITHQSTIRRGFFKFHPRNR